MVYPCVIDEGLTKESSGDKVRSSRKVLWTGKKIVLSINRFERKKSVVLAVRAFAGLEKRARQGGRLVIAGEWTIHFECLISNNSEGGYDRRMPENVSYHRELDNLARSLGLETATANDLASTLSIPGEVDVLFLLSVPSSLKTTLLRAARLLVYTPKFEHFGIVPLEAMLAGLPVLAARTGGPRETVVEEESGWLRDAGDVSQWTAVMNMVLAEMSENSLKKMGDQGRARVLASFSQGSMARRLDEEIQEMGRLKQRPQVFGPRPVLVAGFCLLALLSFVISPDIRGK